jgi:hypothetical protein
MRAASVFFAFLSISAPAPAYAFACIVNGPRYELTSDIVNWSMKIGTGESCIRGLRLGNVTIESLELVSSPRTGQVTIHGPGFTYSAKSEYEGEDDFTIALSGKIRKSRGSSTIRITVSVEKPDIGDTSQSHPPEPFAAPKPLVTSPVDNPMPTPSPSPISTECSGAKNTPGGPDPFAGCFPGPNNTGVPGGTNLTTYTGSCSIRTDNLVIDSMTINCSILNYAQNVTIRNSVLNGTFKNNDSPTATATVQDTTVNAGSAFQGAFEGANLNLLRVNVSGGEHSVHCWSNCSVRDSYLHDQFDGGALGWHQNGFLSNGGSNFTVVHNSVGCIGGCTGDITFINDDSISHATVDKNLLLATPPPAFCAYPAGGSVSKTGVSSYMVWTDNVLQRGANRRCGIYGPVYEWKAQTGNPNQDGYMNVWSGNIWDDGTVVGRNAGLK